MHFYKKTHSFFTDSAKGEVVPIHVMKAYGEVKEYLDQFITSATDGRK